MTARAEGTTPAGQWRNDLYKIGMSKIGLKPLASNIHPSIRDGTKSTYPLLRRRSQDGGVPKLLSFRTSPPGLTFSSRVQG